jgi:hypothetical protein
MYIPEVPKLAKCHKMGQISYLDLKIGVQGFSRVLNTVKSSEFHECAPRKPCGKQPCAEKYYLSVQWLVYVGSLHYSDYHVYAQNPPQQSFGKGQFPFWVSPNAYSTLPYFA